MVCAVDHRSYWRAPICDDQHKIAAVKTKKKSRATYIRVCGPNLSCHEKGSPVPGRTWNYVEEFSCRVWSITDKATTGVALSRERPFGEPRRPFFYYGASLCRFV